MKKNPFGWLSHDRRKLFWPFFAATIIVMVALNMIGAPLNTDVAPYGIISYELAGTPEQAGQILASWDQRAREHAALSLGFDYVFMLAYSITIGLACVWAGDVLLERRWPLSGIAVPLAWGQIAAAILDAVENYALLKILFGSIQSPWPEAAKWCEIVKFCLVFLGLIFAFYSLIVSLVNRLAMREA